MSDSLLTDIPVEVFTRCICSYLSIKDLINIKKTSPSFSTIPLQSINNEFCDMIHKFPLENTVSLHQQFGDIMAAEVTFTLENIGHLIPILFASATKLKSIQFYFNININNHLPPRILLYCNPYGTIISQIPFRNLQYLTFNSVHFKSIKSILKNNIIKNHILQLVLCEITFSPQDLTTNAVYSIPNHCPLTITDCKLDDEYTKSKLQQVVKQILDGNKLKTNRHFVHIKHENDMEQYPKCVVFWKLFQSELYSLRTRYQCVRFDPLITSDWFKKYKQYETLQELTIGASLFDSFEHYNVCHIIKAPNLQHLNIEDIRFHNCRDIISELLKVAGDDDKLQKLSCSFWMDFGDIDGDGDPCWDMSDVTVEIMQYIQQRFKIMQRTDSFEIHILVKIDNDTGYDDAEKDYAYGMEPVTATFDSMEKLLKLCSEYKNIFINFDFWKEQSLQWRLIDKKIEMFKNLVG